MPILCEDVLRITAVHALVGHGADIQSNDEFPVIHRVNETGRCQETMKDITLYGNNFNTNRHR